MENRSKNLIHAEVFICINSYDNFRQNLSFAEYVSKGIPKQSLKDNSCKYHSVMELTTDPTPNTESGNFYMGRLNQNGSDMIKKSCSSDQLEFDKR